MTTLAILNELGSTNSVKDKEAILRKYKDDATLKQFFYKALSPRVKFYIKQIPEYGRSSTTLTLLEAIDSLASLSDRTYTGNAASDWLSLALSFVKKEDAVCLERIIQKDPKCGVNASTVNKVWPKLIEETPYMGAIAFKRKKAEQLFKSDDVVSQTKMDGRYVNFIVDENGKVTLESRSGETTEINSFDSITLGGAAGLVMCGELTIPGIPRYDSNGIIASIVSINKKHRAGKPIGKELIQFKQRWEMDISHAEAKIQFTAWDMISAEEYAKAHSDRAYKFRLIALAMLVEELDHPQIALVRTVAVQNLAEAMADWRFQVANGEEGTIIKGMNGKWEDGKPNWQIKIKLEFSVDLHIVGFNYGKKGTRLEHTVGSLQCVSEDGLVQTDPGGITDEDRAMLLSIMPNLIASNTVVEVTCSGLSRTDNGYSLLHPRFKALRLDKNTADTLESIKAIEASIKELSN